MYNPDKGLIYMKGTLNLQTVRKNNHVAETSTIFYVVFRFPFNYINNLCLYYLLLVGNLEGFGFYVFCTNSPQN